MNPNMYRGVVGAFSTKTTTKIRWQFYGDGKVSYLRPGPRDVCDDVPVSGEAGQAGPGGGGAVGRVVMV